MFKNLLVAYDASPAALKAFERSVEIAKCFSAQLAIVVVLRPPEFAEEVDTRAVLENAAPSSIRKSPAFRRGLAPPALKEVAHTCVGHPAEQIIAAADRWGADLIVTGHRGHKKTRQVAEQLSLITSAGWTALSLEFNLTSHSATGGGKAKCLRNGTREVSAWGRRPGEASDGDPRLPCSHRCSGSPSAYDMHSEGARKLRYDAPAASF